jgi:hypothetical protein
LNFLRKPNRFVVTQFGDKHGGSKLGLMHPEVRLRDSQGNSYIPEMNEAQKYLHELHEKHVDQVLEFADGDDLYVIDLGDVTQGNKHQPETFSTRIADQLQIGRANFWYWLKYKHLKAIRLVVGTPAHNFGEQTAEEIVIDLLQPDSPGVDMKVLYHGLLDIKGVLFDYAHRGPSAGKRNWLKGNEARYYLRSLMEDEIHIGNTPPHLVTRGHYHSFVEEYLSIQFKETMYKSWLYTLPSYCLLGEYAINITGSQYLISNGMIATEVIDGQIGKTNIYKQTLDIRTKETIS